MKIRIEAVLEARQDPEKRELFIENHLTDVARWASKAAGRWVDQHDDLYSEALIAFHDAIIAFAPEKGDFAAFAARVIANRVTDHRRKQQKSQKVIPFSALEETAEDGDMIPFEPVDQRSAQTEVALEIASLEQELQGFDISFSDLPGASPKAGKTRKACMRAVMEIVQDRELLKWVYRTKRLPVSRMKHISSKLMERHRKYIIAGVLIMDGEYTVMAAYFMGGEKR